MARRAPTADRRNDHELREDVLVVSQEAASEWEVLLLESLNDDNAELAREALNMATTANVLAKVLDLQVSGSRYGQYRGLRQWALDLPAIKFETVRSQFGGIYHEGDTILHIALRMRATEVAKALIHAGATTTIQNSVQETPESLNPVVRFWIEFDQCESPLC